MSDQSETTADGTLFSGRIEPTNPYPLYWGAFSQETKYPELPPELRPVDKWGREEVPISTGGGSASTNSTASDPLAEGAGKLVPLVRRWREDSR